jgi:hypothetical protein
MMPLIVLNHFIYSETKELRLNYDLCDEEKYFLEKRKEEIFKRIPKLSNLKQVPISVDEVKSCSSMHVKTFSL